MKKIVYATLGFLYLFGVIGTSSLQAQWPDDAGLNLLLSDRSGEQTITKVVPTSDGGCYVSWWDNTSGNYDFYLQRLDGDGVPQWAEDGLLISNHVQDSWLTDYCLAVDSLDHAIIAINDLRAGGDWDIYGYRISPTGESVWGPDGLAISNNAYTEYMPYAIVTSAGNVVFTWMDDSAVYLRKVTPAGTDSWDPAIITITYTYPLTIPRLAQTPDDGFILQYLKSTGPNYYNPKHLYAHKFDASGNNLWDANGVVVSNAGGFGPQMRPDIFSDGLGGAFSYWYDSRDMNLHAFAQHIKSDGTMAWTANGVVVSTNTAFLQMGPACIYLPATNELVLFFENTDLDQNSYGVYAQKIDSTGARGWTNSGLALVAMGNQQKMLYQACRMENDAVVVYLENTPGSVVNSLTKAIRVNSAGVQVWDPSPAILSSVVSNKGYLDACANNRNQVIAAWTDKRNSSSPDVYLQNVNPDGSLGPLPPPMGEIHGQVANWDGLSPAPDVIVQNFDSLNVLVGTDTTDVTGAYFFFNVLPGLYHELLTKPGYDAITLDSITVIADSITHVTAFLGPPLGCTYIVGDINGNGTPNGIDVGYGVNYFKGGPTPPIRCDMCPQTPPFYAAGDVNGSCVFNGIDVTFFVNYLKGIVPALLYCPSCPPAM